MEVYVYYIDTHKPNTVTVSVVLKVLSVTGFFCNSLDVLSLPLVWFSAMCPLGARANSL